MVDEKTMEILRARFFPDIEDKDPNYRYFGLDRMQFKKPTCGHLAPLDQWTGRCTMCLQVEEKKKLYAERQINVQCPMCGSRLRYGECIQVACSNSINNRYARARGWK